MDDSLPPCVPFCNASRSVGTWPGQNEHYDDGDDHDDNYDIDNNDDHDDKDDDLTKTALPCNQQARKPQSYASLKLWTTVWLTHRGKV